MYIYWYDYFRADTDYKTSRRLKTNICDWYSFAKIKLCFIGSVTQKSQISITRKNAEYPPDNQPVFTSWSSAHLS